MRLKNIKEIENIPHVFDVSYNEQTLVVRCTGAKHNLIRILEYMNNKDISFGRVFSELPTLNDVFLEITGKKNSETKEYRNEVCYVTRNKIQDINDLQG